MGSGGGGGGLSRGSGSAVQEVVDLEVFGEGEAALGVEAVQP